MTITPTAHDRLKAGVQQQIDQLTERLERLEIFGADEYENETVLMYQAKGVLFQRLVTEWLTCVAIKAGGRWWVSNGHNKGYSWDELISLMADSPEVWVVTEWDQVL